MRLRAHQRAFRSPFGNLRSPLEAIERPMGRPVPIRAGVGASFPTKGNFFGKVVACCCKQGGFPRGKQSARPALPCAPLVVCLNSGALTACGGCIHWIPAFLRSPLHPFGSSPAAIERPMGRQAPLTRRSRRVRPRRGQGIAPAGTPLRTQGHPPATLFPSRRPPHEDHRPHRRHRLR